MFISNENIRFKMASIKYLIQMKRKRKLNMPKKKWKPDRYIHVNILKQLFPKA